MRPLAIVLESGAPERLYTGLSLAVSAAAAGRAVHVLTGFGATPVLAGTAPPPPGGRPEPFARTLAELVATARELCAVQACAAAGGATSMPAFLASVGDAELVVV